MLQGNRDTCISAVGTAAFLLSLLASTALSQSTGDGACDPSTGLNPSGGACCQQGGKYCTQINPTYLNTTANGVCLWPNLAGQTPDSNPEFNVPYLNDFACGSNNCNFASDAAVSDTAYTGGSVYYGLVESLTSANLSNISWQATDYYAKFNVALSRYNCEEQYSHWNCDDCRKAYARWACAMTIPACQPSSCATTFKPCVRVCNEVVQKCPVTLGFTCPDDNRDYGESSCNYMGLTAGASETTSSFMLVLTTAFVVTSFAQSN